MRGQLLKLTLLSAGDAIHTDVQSIVFQIPALCHEDELPTMVLDLRSAI